MSAAPLDLADIPLVAECRIVDDMPTFLAAVRAEIDAGRGFVWLFRQSDGTDRTGFIIGADGPLFRVRDSDARPVGIFADFQAAIMAGLQHADRVEGA